MKRVFVFAAVALSLSLFSCADTGVSVGSDDDSGGGGGGGGGGGTSNASAVIITLTRWQTTDTDVGGLDPRIHFQVRSYKNGIVSTLQNTHYLLDAQDIGQTWSGSRSSGRISFSSTADWIEIHCIAVEKDPLFNDDISPSTYATFYNPKVGDNGSKLLDYGSGKSKVNFDYEFVRQ